MDGTATFVTLPLLVGANSVIGVGSARLQSRNHSPSFELKERGEVAGGRNSL